MIQLSPIDHVFTGVGSYPIESIFAYGGRLDAERLSASLRQTLAIFPAASSRLVRASGGVYALEPDPEGCGFQVAATSTSFDDAADRHAFVDPVETVEGQPLARVRLTHTPTGSILGVGLSHAVVDGFSYFYFLSAWSRVFHGRDVPPPWLDRGLLVPADLEAGERLGREDVRAGCGLFLDERRPSIPRDRLRWTARLFSTVELAEMLAEAQRDCPVRLSHNDVVTAWLWRTHVSEWAPSNEETSYLSCPVDVRRLLPGFPPTYFGCAVVLATAAVERQRLGEAPLGELARLVRDAVAGVNESKARQSLLVIDRLRRQGGLEGLERLHVVHPRAGLLVTNLSRLPVREIVFDAGPPVAFDIPAPVERCAVVLPAEGGLDVRICLPAGAAPPPNR
jgi:shikimate O-hydroxycinnamoyltransferase